MKSWRVLRMSSELVKKLEKEHTYYIRSGEPDLAFGVGKAILIVKEHEAQQMKEPFYQLDEEQEEALRLRKSTYLYFKSIGRPWIPDLKVEHAFTEWAIEQEKLEEEK